MDALWELGFWVWGVALLATASFLGWYVNWRGALTPGEIERFLGEFETGQTSSRNDLTVLRKFLEADDGREFLMLNLVKTVREAPDPVTGTMTPGPELLDKYTSVFMRALFAKGGHPAMAARKIGGYVDAWNTPPDPGWQIVGFMRYRSRRDMMKLVIDPRFLPAHDFKFAAMAETFSFPTHPVIRTYATPAVWVPLLFAFGAAISQIALLVSA
ncbi:hypothetical protein [Parvibaculum sp.]|jgi:hypothetical protein|uniref:hypothetical protein n=2 Tax=Parvibaculum sp. TaxID=2024848 RepID=UPI001B0651C5|nr:hypothetical protein [Parvibaculum sp.]MBO6634418.1 hypothetical protein [Parvibaculum sp.]MBO6679173.1 hypothetical protein [Parvibaculum sp.]